MLGWICPKCQAVHAPHIASCPCSPPQLTMPTTYCGGDYAHGEVFAYGVDGKLIEHVKF